LLAGTPLLVGGFAGGVFLGRRGGRKASIVCGAAVAVVLLRMAGRFYPQFEFQWLNNDGYSFLRPWWAFLPGMLVFGIAVFQVRNRWVRVAAEGVAGFVLLFFCLSMYATATLDLNQFAGTVNDRGNCLQTSAFSCGAAAAATFLHHHGIAATEREMVRLCGTNHLTGTDEFAAARGIRKKSAGRLGRIRLEKGGPDRLSAERLPAMATVRRSFRADHWVVVTGRTGNRLHIADPNHGVGEESVETFRKRWRGVLLYAEPKTARGS
jgi:hypothetical protein